jgi:hypothetical protein
MLVLSNVKGRILFVSGAYSGSAHDYSLLKDKFPPQKAAWFDETHLYVDLGFLGIAKDYKTKGLNIPQKRGKKQDMTEDQKTHNKQVSKVRIKVEHSIGGMKRFRFLSDRLRCRDFTRYNQIVGICAALWNFNYI